MQKRAFTLIELMITIAIIGVLTGMAVIAYSFVNERSRDAQRMNDLNQIKVSLTTYYNAQTPSSYVSTTGTVMINASTDALTTALVPNYLRVMPTDPVNTGVYVYKYTSQNSAKDFLLTATLENQNNKKGWGGGSSWVQDGYQVVDN